MKVSRVVGLAVAVSALGLMGIGLKAGVWDPKVTVIEN
jgi:hypothetical protein